MTIRQPSPISSDQAWQILDRWRLSGREIGLIFYGRSNTLYSLAKVMSLKNGTLGLAGEESKTTFRLANAEFKYGPMQVYPRWPSPPIVEVNALQAALVGGDWLALADELTPEMAGMLTQ